MPHRPHRLGLTLALASGLAGCLATAPAGPKGRVGASEAPKAPATQASATAPPAGVASDRPASAASLGVPARIHVAFPQALLTGANALFLGPQGTALLANDGASLIANDGAALLANDGSSLIANDGAGLIANDGTSAQGPGGAYRLAQNANALQAVDLFVQVWRPQQEIGALIRGTVALYGAQAVYVQRVLAALGTLRLRSGVPSLLELAVPFAPGLVDQLTLNVVARPGPGGHPVLWLYNMHQVPPGGPFPEPFMALEVTGAGQGGLWWRPPFADGAGRGFWFATRFDLQAKRCSADLQLRGLNGEQRRLSWDFLGSAASDPGAWRSHWTAVLASPNEGGQYRRAVLEGNAAGEVLCGVQAAPAQATWPADALFRWVAPSGQTQAEAVGHTLRADGELSSGPEAPTPGLAGFGTQGLRAQGLQSLGPLAADRVDPLFDWPQAPPDTQAWKPVLPP